VSSRTVTPLARIRRFAALHDLWRPDTRVIAAVSGGSDSVAMLRLLHDLHLGGELHLDAVAHLNHRIRPDADEDEAFCAALAAQLEVPFASSAVDVPARARAMRQSLEVAGRSARREFFQHLLRTRGADRIATAHTEDDQAETLLLRLLRGAGQRGVSAIAPRRGRRLRPVLWATRVELRRDLERRDQPWREDSTNTDLTNPRNRVRHELIPYLERHFNPSVRRALARFADAARADDTLLARQAAAAAASLVLHDDLGNVRLDAGALLALPEGISRRVVRFAIGAAGNVEPDAQDVAAVFDIARGDRGAADIRGLRVEPFREFVVLLPRGATRAPAPFRFELTVPGEVRLHDAGWMLEASGPFGQPQIRPWTREVAQIDATAVGTALVVRSRQPGDRMRPAGLDGSKKVQDILVDRKVHRHDRDTVPIVTDRRGRIVWLAGHVVGEEFRVTEGTKAVIILKLRRI
jgi:tRNA(Ile)-lysidine synthase